MMIVHPRIHRIAYRTKSVLERFLHSILQILALSGILRKGRGAKTKRVLLSRCDSTGDVVLFSATLPAYRALFRDAELILVVKTSAAPLLNDSPWVDQIWVLDESKFRSNVLEQWRWFRRLQGGGFEIALNAVYSRSFDQFDCIAGWTGASRRIAHHCLDRIKPREITGWFYNELAPATSEWKPETERNGDLLRYLGWRGTVPERPQLRISESDSSTALRLTRGQPRYGILSPGAGFPEKQWIPERFVETVAQVHCHRRLYWYVCGTRSEAGLCSRVTRMLTERSIPATDLSGHTTIGELAGLIRGAQIVLGNDSSPVHIARALTTPAVFVLGGGHYGRFFTGNEGDLCVHVTHPLPCFQCYWKCVLPEYECITRVSVDEVVHAVLSLPSISDN